MSVPLLARLLTLICAVALTANAAAPCAGWQAEADARLECCTSHCPMQADQAAMAHHGMHGAAEDSSRADACCSISEERDAEPSAKPRLAAAVLLVADLGSTPAPHAPSASIPPAQSRPIRTVPTHLLLSVLLV